MKSIIFSIFIFFCVLQADVALSKGTYNTLIEVQKLSGEKQYKEALKLVNEQLSKDLKKEDKAYLFQSKGFILTSTNKYKQAIKAFEQMNLLEVMDEATHIRTLYNLAQLNMSIKEYNKSIAYLKKYLQKNKEQNADAYILLAQSHLLLEQTKEAIPHIKQAIQIKEQINKKVPFSWRELLFSSYYKIKDYKNAITTLDIMVRLKPLKKEYWEYLYQLYTLEKQLKKGLNTFEQAYNLKLLKGKDILRFVRFLASNKLYFKSAKLLHKHMDTKEVESTQKNLKLLYTLYYSAKEYELALQSLDLLIDKSKKSEHYLEKARILNMTHQYSKASIAYESALKDKQLKNYPKVIMEVAYLYYELENNSKCKEYLDIAKKFKQTRDKAQKFLEQI